MATLQYIAGQQIAGADKYRLYKVNGDGSNERILYKPVVQEFNHDGIMVGGKVMEERKWFSRNGGEENGSELITPLRMLTEEGVKTGFKVEGVVNIIYNDGVRLDRYFESVHYLRDNREDSIAVWMPASYNQIIEKDDGWYLNVTVRGVENMAKIIDANSEIKSVMFYPTYNDLELVSAALGNNYKHTDYIYIPCLSENITPPGGTDPVCVGPFDLSQDLGYDKLSFYNKNLKFLGGAKVPYIAGELEAGAEYLTKDDVQYLAQDVTGISDPTHEDYPRFVVFCSKWSGTALKDRVSIGNPYFPLFETEFKQEGIASGTQLAVTADSNSQYYTESALSKVVTYTTNT